MNTYDKHMKQYAKVPGTRAGPGVREFACGALGNMGVDPALSAEAKPGIVATLTAATKDSSYCALRPRH